MAKIEHKYARQYRGRIEIAANILEIAKNGSRKTRIMYLGNLSFDLVQKYLGMLEQLGLIEVRDTNGEKAYYTSEKGKQFLIDFNDLQQHSQIAQDKKRILENALGQKIKAG